MFSCALLFFIAGIQHCLSSETAGGDPAAKKYEARGVVEHIPSDFHQVTIHHQAIPDYMMEMTMDFPVRNTNELNGVQPGDQITFTLVVAGNDDWIENIHRIGHVTDVMTNAMKMDHAMLPELKPGDLMPDGALLAEDGRNIHFSDFRGKAVAFTFFFTRCPLPNYCPLMNRNFAAARALVLAKANAPTNWQFLSISFDPGFDRPEVLSNYANFYRSGDASHWLFASASTNVLANLAPRLDLMIMHQGASISHNLRTVVLNPHGVIFRQFDGNEWTPQQLADALVQAAIQPMH